MNELSNRQDVSIISAIVRQQFTSDVIDVVFTHGDKNVLYNHARGTLVKDRWYHSFVPVVSPETDYLQFLVPDDEVNFIMDQITQKAHLHLAGSGAVFCSPCQNLYHTADYGIWSWEKVDKSPQKADSRLKENLTAIYCVVQKDQAEPICRAAMQAGTHGPVVYFSEGRGLRDRLGWLRITKKTTKETIVMIVDNMDAEYVCDAIIEVGRFDRPGHGILYRAPVQKGLINIASTYGQGNHVANMQQIISAIDDLTGNPHWRHKKISGFRRAANKKNNKRRYLMRQSSLTCIASRQHANDLIETAIEQGARGVNISYKKFIQADSKVSSTGVRINRERAMIHFILDESRLQPVIEAMKKVIAEAEDEFNEVCIYTQPVSKVMTFSRFNYQGPEQRSYVRQDR